MAFIFYGNETAKAQIKNYIKKSSIPQAIIVLGDKGVGKKTFAKEIAKMILCCEKETIPCGRCNPCQKVEKEIHPDVICANDERYAKTSKMTKTIGVDVIRKIISESSVMPNESEKKIFIIPCDRKMTVEAQNAFLKTLEEPNSFSIFIITCEDKSALLDTVVSRSVIISLNAVNWEEFQLGVKQSLQIIDEKNEKDDQGKSIMTGTEGEENLKSLYYLTDGNIGKAVYCMSGGIYQNVLNFGGNAINAIIQRDEYALLKNMFALKGKKELFDLTMDYIQIIVRGGIVKEKVKESNEELNIICKKVSQNLTKWQILCIIDILNSTRENLKYNINENLNLTALCGKIFSLLSSK